MLFQTRVLDNEHDATDETGGSAVRLGWRDVPALFWYAFCRTWFWWLALAAVFTLGRCWL